MRSAPTPQLRWLAAALMGGALGLGAACLLELDQGFSCGDGYVQRLGGEQCDPQDPERAHVEACRAKGFVIDAECDPITCQILDSVTDCSVCGDGIASHDEQCDGDDHRGAACSINNGVGRIECTSNCTLDFSDCPEDCGDGVVSGNEECDYASSCDSDLDCPPGQICYPNLGECVDTQLVPGNDPDSFMRTPVVRCADYEVTAKQVEDKDNYTSGDILGCSKTDCVYGRNNCGFCGDGVLDGEYIDYAATGGETKILAEECDGDMADVDELVAYCRPRCLVPPYDPATVVHCDFECAKKCKFPDDDPPDDVSPGSFNCCLPPGARCEGEGVPDLPCCTAPDQPKADVCVWSNDLPVRKVCPTF